MITVAKLKEELNKFPDDGLCYAYEGEVTGIIVNKVGLNNQGVIYCSESGDDRESDLLEV